MKFNRNVSVALICGGIVAGGAWLLMQARLHPFEQDPVQWDYATTSGYALEITNSLDMVFRLVPPGVYLRGSPMDEPWRTLDERQHEVRIPTPFYMAATEVTQAQFTQVMGTNTSFIKTRPTTPVDSMTFIQALEFCNRLSEMEGLTPVYIQAAVGWEQDLSNDGYRLPLEAEWEYACRAGTTTAFYTGGLTPLSKGARNAERAAWYAENAKGSPHEVATREPNGWGLYDMLGNVQEWCWDWYAAYPLTSEILLSGPVRGNQGRVIRGGCWYDRIEFIRAASRKPYSPFEPSNVLGFRVARAVN